MRKLAAVLAFVLPIVALAAPVAIQPLPTMRAWTDATFSARDRAQDAMEASAVAVADAVLSQQDAGTITAYANTYSTLRGAYVASATTTALVLVRGPGPAANPAPAPVAGHVPPNPVTASRAGAVIQWTDASGSGGSVPLNLFATTIGASGSTNTPDLVEFSLDGGPWVAAKSDLVVMPDLGPGVYQVRVVDWPASGNSVPLAPLTITRTTAGWTSQ